MITIEELRQHYIDMGGAPEDVDNMKLTPDMVSKLAAIYSSGEPLPDVDQQDNGKFLGVKNGVWDKVDLAQPTVWIGVTTTELTDGSTTNPITINNKQVTAVAGNITQYDGIEYVFDGEAWQEFGGGGGALFITLTKSGSTYSVDKTWNEIVDAYESGKSLFVQTAGSLVTSDSFVQGFNLYFGMTGYADSVGLTFGGAYRSATQTVEVTVYIPAQGAVQVLTRTYEGMATKSGTVGQILMRTGSGQDEYQWSDVDTITPEAIGAVNVDDTTSYVSSVNGDTGAVLIPVIDSQGASFGDVLTADGAGGMHWSTPPGSVVTSVNGAIGDVYLDAGDVGALPDSTIIPTTAGDIGALPDTTFIPETASDVGAVAYGSREYVNDVTFIDSSLEIHYGDGQSSYIQLPSATYAVGQLTSAEYVTALLQLRQAAIQTPGTPVNVSTISAAQSHYILEACRLTFYDGLIPVLIIGLSLDEYNQLKDYGGAICTGMSLSHNIVPTSVSFEMEYTDDRGTSFHFEMTICESGEILMSVLCKDTVYTPMPGGDEHTVYEVCEEIEQSLSAMSYSDLYNAMDNGHSFSVPFATPGWDSSGATAFTMDPNAVDDGNIVWATLEYTVRINYDYSLQTFEVAVNIWD